MPRQHSGMAGALTIDHALGRLAPLTREQRRVEADLRDAVFMGSRVKQEVALLRARIADYFYANSEPLEQRPT